MRAAIGTCLLYISPPDVRVFRSSAAPQRNQSNHVALQHRAFGRSPSWAFPPRLGPLAERWSGLFRCWPRTAAPYRLQGPTMGRRERAQASRLALPLRRAPRELQQTSSKRDTRTTSYPGITFANLLVLVRPPRGGTPRPLRGLMLGANILHHWVLAAGLLSLLMITGCAAVTEGEIMHDGQPCNVLCQRWMGIENPPQNSTPTSTPIVQDEKLSIRSPTPSVDEPRPKHVHRVAADASPASRRSSVIPAVVPSSAALTLNVAPRPLSGWGTHLPGSPQTLSDVWMPIP